MVRRFLLLVLAPLLMLGMLAYASPTLASPPVSPPTQTHPVPAVPPAPVPVPPNWGVAGAHSSAIPNQPNPCYANSNYTIFSQSTVGFSSDTWCAENGPTIGTQSQLWWYDTIVNQWYEVTHEPANGLRYCSLASQHCPVAGSESQLEAGEYYVQGVHYCSICSPNIVYSQSAEFYISG